MEKYYIWLLLAFGESSPEISELIKRFGTAENVYKSFEKNVSLSGMQNISRAEKIPLSKAQTLCDSIANSGVSIITWESPDYPAHLRRTASPPCALFAQGDTSLLHKKLITVVGSRKVTPYTEYALPQILERLGGEYAIVSSLSEGCDQLTCLNAMRSGIPFIEVMPCGFSQTYPAGSKSLRSFLLSNGGLLISEYMPKTHTGQGSFRRRSRIIGGISYVTLVLQAGENSGALATAEYSYAPIFLPPNNIFAKEYAGAVNAVRGGAKLYLSEKSIENAFARAMKKENSGSEVKKEAFRKNSKRSASAPQNQKQGSDTEHEKEQPAENTAKLPGREAFESDEQYTVYSFIAGSLSPVSSEEIISGTGLPAETVSEVLLDLEMSDMLSGSGNRYSPA